jgi:hypothetical protein
MIFKLSGFGENCGDQHIAIFDPGEDIAVHFVHELAADIQAQAATAAVF